MNKKPNSFFTKPLELSENGVLAKLWRDFIEKNNLYKHMRNIKLRRYNDKTQVSISGDVIKTKKKHSIENDIESGKMTFPVFSHLMFNLMEVKDLTITITSTLDNGEVTINTISIPNPKIALGEHKDEK
jgi:hypothetical protein